MRKLLIAVGLLLAAGSTKAQENRGFEVSGSYQFVRFDPGGGSDGINCHGGFPSGPNPAEGPNAIDGRTRLERTVHCDYCGAGVGAIPKTFQDKRRLL